MFERVVEAWRTITEIGDYLPSCPREIVREAEKVATFGLNHSEEETDRRFRHTSPAVQEATVVWLLQKAFEVADDYSIAGWTADYANRCAQQLSRSSTEPVALHARFVLAWALQRVGDRRAAEILLLELEGQYQSTSANPSLSALTACALGALALADDDVNGDRLGIPGAREAFNRAWRYLGDSSPSLELAEVLHYAEYLRIQWKWLDKLLLSDDPQREFEKSPAWVNDDLAELLRGRMRRLAASRDDVAAAYRAGEIADLVLERLGKLPEALSEYTARLWDEEWLEELEWVVLRRLEVSPEDQELREELANVYVMEEKYREALPLLAVLTRAHPDDPHLHTLAGTALWKTGNLPAAYQAFCAVHRIAPDYAGTSEMLQRLRPAACILFLDERLRYHPDVELLTPDELRAGVMAAVLAEKPDTIEARLRQVGDTEPHLLPLLFDILSVRGLIRARSPEAFNFDLLTED